VRAALVLALSAAACGRLRFDVDGGASDATSDAAGDATQVPGLIGWWKLDEGSGNAARDATGTTTGILVGSGLVWLPTGGKFGGALQFPGTADDVQFGQPAVFANLPGVTVSAWIQPSSVTHDANAHCFFDHGSSVTPAGGWYGAVADVANGDVAFAAFFGNLDYARRASTPGMVAVGTWSHVVATWDGTSIATGIHIYVDGVEVTYAQSLNATNTVRPDDSSITVAIGCAGPTSFAGIEDDVKLFGRVLSPAEIGQL
jgi:hypothetical protein